MQSISERDKDLLRAYREVLEKTGYPFSLTEVMEKTVKKPAKRFYASFRYVYECIKALKDGRPIRYQQKEKERMIYEIWERVQVEEKCNPDIKLNELVENILDSPAPEFFLKPSSAEVILCKAKRRQQFIEEQLIKDRYERIQRRKNRPLIR
ncbi:MAG: hypothetical protein PHP34_07585 [Bacteroidales bacterium]|uniref:hypothetical protein n=1 Tax=Petrimonas sp. TaxID=2023866 RepID=UPI002A2A58C1|nr:hypothetical protein [Bacteroidales bacterium]